ESIISITSLPWSRKYSAIVVAVKAALMRTSAGWSDVATTTTLRVRPEPRSRSMNSRTSRPRSPTRQITFTSALVERAIIPRSDDLPTPEPAKSPRRRPLSHGAGAAEDSEGGPAAAGEGGVERPHPEGDPPLDRPARERRRRCADRRKQ